MGISMSKFRSCRRQVLESLRTEYSQPDFGNEWFIDVDVENMKNLIIQNPTYQDNRRLNPIQP